MAWLAACCCFQKKTALVRKVRLVRKNPLPELSEAQFKKNFVFERLIFLAWLLCYHGPLYFAHNMGWYSLQRFVCLWFLPKQRNSAISILKDIQKFGNLQIHFLCRNFYKIRHKNSTQKLILSNLKFSKKIRQFANCRISEYIVLAPLKFSTNCFHTNTNFWYLTLKSTVKGATC